MSQPTYYGVGATASATDTKLVRWAKRLGRFQGDTAGESRFNPQKGDTASRLLHKLTSSVNQGWTSILSGVEFGQGEPTKSPHRSKKVYVQRDSIPPNRLWVFYNDDWA